jgi:hypothetical protein
VLAAGLTGTALGLLGGRVASASPDTTEPTEEGSTPPSSAAPATTTTLPPKRPSTTDLALLNYAESIELAATNLYQASLDAGAKDDLVKMLVANHRGYADLIRGILGTRSIGIPDTSLYDERLSKFQVADLEALAPPAYDLESALVATHTDLLAKLEGTDGAADIASILIVEARQAVVLADAAGKGGDFDALFDDTAIALTPPTSGG